MVSLLCFVMLMSITSMTASAQNTCAINKWVQLPDETIEGIDVRMDHLPGVSRRLLADDFLCEQTGPITCVKFWGSWDKDSSVAGNTAKGTLESIHLSIHADVPVGPGNPFSYPLRPPAGAVLWEMDFGPASFTETLYLDLCPDPANPTTCSGEGFWDPSGELWPGVNPGDTYVPNADSRIWLYTVNIPAADAFVQQGTAADPIVYWLDINVLIKDEFDGVVRSFGWKTSIDNWNDNAVYDINGVDWAELTYPPGFINPARIDGQIDLAFEINTEQTPPPTEACCIEDHDPLTGLPTGTFICQDLTVPDCLAQGGTPQGFGTDCTTVDCDPPLDDGACCLLDGSCIVTTQVDCENNHDGTYQGDGVPCTAATCPKCIPPDVPCANGESSIASSYLAGSIDNFAPAPEPATPDAALSNFITNCTAPPGYALQFDELPGSGGVSANSWFGHTFTTLPPSIVSATLEVRARATPGAGGGLAFNDTIGFVDTISGCSATYLWLNRFVNLTKVPGTHNSANGVWNAGDSATFCLDLDNLVKSDGSLTSVISSLASGRLSVITQDDTGIDYLLLNIRVCPCKYPIEIVIPVGENDNFDPTLPADDNPASPSAEITGAFVGLKGIDDLTSNRRFVHTFTGLPAGIVGGSLEVGLRAHADIPTNDGMALEFLNPNFRWGRAISTLAPTGAWTNGTSKVITLDLASLPPSGTGETSVIGDMTDGDLDVYFQDDTAVDYMILTLKVCCDDKIPGDVDSDGDVDIVDFAVGVAANWLTGLP
jgi:hypothetical protein